MDEKEKVIKEIQKKVGTIGKVESVQKKGDTYIVKVAAGTVFKYNPKTGSLSYTLPKTTTNIKKHPAVKAIEKKVGTIGKVESVEYRNGEYIVKTASGTTFVYSPDGKAKHSLVKNVTEQLSKQGVKPKTAIVYVTKDKRVGGVIEGRKEGETVQAIVKGKLEEKKVVPPSEKLKYAPTKILNEYQKILKKHYSMFTFMDRKIKLQNIRSAIEEVKKAMKDPDYAIKLIKEALNKQKIFLPPEVAEKIARYWYIKSLEGKVPESKVVEMFKAVEPYKVLSKEMLPGVGIGFALGGPVGAVAAGLGTMARAITVQTATIGAKTMKELQERLKLGHAVSIPLDLAVSIVGGAAIQKALKVPAQGIIGYWFRHKKIKSLSELLPERVAKELVKTAEQGKALEIQFVRMKPFGKVLNIKGTPREELLGKLVDYFGSKVSLKKQVWNIPADILINNKIGYKALLKVRSPLLIVARKGNRFARLGISLAEVYIPTKTGKLMKIGNRILIAYHDVGKAGISLDKLRLAIAKLQGKLTPTGKTSMIQVLDELKKMLSGSSIVARGKMKLIAVDMTEDAARTVWSKLLDAIETNNVQKLREAFDELFKLSGRKLRGFFEIKKLGKNIIAVDYGKLYGQLITKGKKIAGTLYDPRTTAKALSELLETGKLSSTGKKILEEAAKILSKKDKEIAKALNSILSLPEKLTLKGLNKSSPSTVQQAISGLGKLLLHTPVKNAFTKTSIVKNSKNPNVTLKEYAKLYVATKLYPKVRHPAIERTIVESHENILKNTPDIKDKFKITHRLVSNIKDKNVSKNIINNLLKDLLRSNILPDRITGNKDVIKRLKDIISKVFSAVVSKSGFKLTSKSRTQLKALLQQLYQYALDHGLITVTSGGITLIIPVKFKLKGITITGRGKKKKKVEKVVEKKGRVIIKYTPSLAALILDIRGKIPKNIEFTGLEIRPIPS